MSRLVLHKTSSYNSSSISNLRSAQHLLQVYMFNSSGVSHLHPACVTVMVASSASSTSPGSERARGSASRPAKGDDSSPGRKTKKKRLFVRLEPSTKRRKRSEIEEDKVKGDSVKSQIKNKEQAKHKDNKDKGKDKEKRGGLRQG